MSWLCETVQKQPFAAHPWWEATLKEFSRSAHLVLVAQATAHSCRNTSQMVFEKDLL